MGKAKSRISGVVVVGPLTSFRGDFEAELTARGYSPRTSVNHLRQMLALSLWLQAQGLTAADLHERRVQEFLAERRASGRARWSWEAVGLQCLLEVLREQGIVANCAPAAPVSDTDALLGAFQCHLLQERGLAVGTVFGYVLHARAFLFAHPDPPLELRSVTAAHVTAAVLAHADCGGAVSTTQNFIAGLRAFLRYCFVEGLVETDRSRPSFTLAPAAMTA